jgi:hypothetical protein
MQTRLLTAAGFTSLGSVDVQHGNGTGHMFGVFKAPDGTTWVTSNEDFRQVSPSNAKVGVTQADLDATLKQMTGDLYHTQNVSGFRFSSAATTNLPKTGDPAVDSIHRPRPPRAKPGRAMAAAGRRTRDDRVRRRAAPRRAARWHPCFA